MPPPPPPPPAPEPPTTASTTTTSTPTITTPRTNNPRLRDPFAHPAIINHVPSYPSPPTLYIGALPAAKDRALLRRLNITRVVVVLEDAASNPAARQPFAQDGVRYLAVPAADAVSGENCNLLEWFPVVVRFVEGDGGGGGDEIGDGGNVLVHCLAGSSRSGTVLVALLMWKLRIGRDEALKLAREARGVVAPNSAFWDQLREWDRVVFRRREARGGGGVAVAGGGGGMVLGSEGGDGDGDEVRAAAATTRTDVV
ncbi:protein-tyrosine phosphatase-like protein [Zopfochytrium polystomum]|nr:protein-tyrosine phosphatase-like protein [Zopfochytrium polystomum]